MVMQIILLIITYWRLNYAAEWLRNSTAPRPLGTILLIYHVCLENLLP